MKYWNKYLAWFLALLLWGATGITVAADDTGKSGEAMILSSIAFKHNGKIPVRYTCDGEDISPPLAWESVPETAKSLVLIVDDPDAPDPAAPKMTWVHWVLYNLPPGTGSLPEAVTAETLPDGTMVGQNDWKRQDYGGPCPPIGRHRYFYKLYALDITLSEIKTPTKAAVEKAMADHIIASAELVGTYKRIK